MTFYEWIRGFPTATRSKRNEVDQHSQESLRNSALEDHTAESLLISGSSTQIQHSSHRYKGITIWWQELAAAILLCVAVVASYATLAPYAGKSLPEWPRYITISALLSTYSVVLRLAATFLLAEGLAQLKWRWFNKGDAVPLHDLVLHDSATRGPIGSLQLLWRRPQPITWQWLGCILVVLILAVGPLTQLVLQYEPCQVLMHKGERTASIPRASVFFGQGSHAGAGLNSLSLDEQNAISSGIYSLGYPRTECSSGNCTFAPYTSVGFCSQCDDISTEVQFEMGVPEQGGSRTWASSFIPDNSSTPYISDLVSTNYSYGRGDKNIAAARNVIFRDRSSFITVTGPPKMTDDGSILDCNTNRTWACQGYAATACNLFPCIRNYTAAMTNGVFREEVANTWIAPFGIAGDWADGRSLQTAINKSCLTEEQSSELRAMNYLPDGDGPWLEYNTSLKGVLTHDARFYLAAMEQDLLDRQCLYAVDYLLMRGLDDYLGSSTFSGNITARFSASSMFLSFDGPPLMLAIHNNGDISFDRTQAVWENISLALTNHMRLNPYAVRQSGSGPPFVDKNNSNMYNLVKASAPAPGLSFTTKTCLRVRWGWLAFPTSLAALNLVFFTGVLLSAGGLTRDVRTWKSSPLPLLFYGLPLPGIAADSQHVEDLDRVAKSTNVSLARDVHGNMVLRRWGAHNAEI